LDRWPVKLQNWSADLGISLEMILSRFSRHHKKSSTDLVANLFLRFRARLAIAFFESIRNDNPDFFSLFGGPRMRGSRKQVVAD
jgi:hypothetical protein